MPTASTVHDLCLERGLTHVQLAQQSGLDEQRTLAIVLGRWTPSPRETATGTSFGR